MNTSALKAFAPAVRRRLMDLVSRKLDYVLSVPTPDYRTTYAKQVALLRDLERTGRTELVERVAYSWFNRFTALRFLDARGWHPFRTRVLTAASESETLPELLAAMRSGSLPAELTDDAKVLARLHGLLDGTVRSDDPQGELYRELVLAACHFYHKLLPDVFERLDDESELLLPEDLLTEQSVVQAFRTEIRDSDCESVEVLGWLYQFYIAEKKDTVMARKSAVPTEDIPAVTQLFTPHWIVRYLVENSLGRLWLLNRPDSRLREHMPYYIEGEPESDFLRLAKPDEIKLLDPACGSGHMLTYAFDLLYAIYEEEGYAPGDIPAHILRNNLYGLDICPRAAQLAEMALVFKAREKSRRWFQTGIVQPNVLALQDIRFDQGELREYCRALNLGALFDPSLLKLLEQFEQATTFGSLIQPGLDGRSIAFARDAVERKDLAQDLFYGDVHKRLLRALSQAEMLSPRYHIVVANPPYMGRKGMNAVLAEHLTVAFGAGKSDLMTAFMLRGPRLLQPCGFFACVTLDSWMFLSSYVDLRRIVLHDTTMNNLLHVGWNCFPDGHVYNRGVAFVVENTRSRGAGKYVSVSDVSAVFDKHELFKERRRTGVSTYTVAACDFDQIPGAPLAYWVSPKLFAAFSFGSLGSKIETEGQNKTADNDRFLRRTSEVSSRRVGEGKKWLLYAKGGPFRKWYGNLETVVDWSDQARAHYSNSSSCRIVDKRFWYKQGVTWTDFTSGPTSFRLLPEGTTFDMTGPAAFFAEDSDCLAALALLNTGFVNDLLAVFNPTRHVQLRDVRSVPLPQHFDVESACAVALRAIEIARDDWDSFETSWEFQDFPLLRPHLKAANFAASWTNWQTHTTDAITQMQALETENNRLFIEAYGLQDELSPEVPEDQITLARADQRKDIAAFLSYAVGCMMGRYSVDKPGLILADAGDTLEQYVAKVGKQLDDLKFTPDEDGIIPLLDGEWFADDVVARTREFLIATFGAATLRDNLRFIETALGKDLRKYFLTDFYKDHLQTYKKRPIYWLVQSPKKGFGALVYLHRYTRDTMNLVLNRYLREYQVKLRAHVTNLEREEISGSVAERTVARKEREKLEKVLRECEEWERQTLLPVAQERIALDLDDGVKVNYLKLRDALATIPGLAAAEE